MTALHGGRFGACTRAGWNAGNRQGSRNFKQHDAACLILWCSGANAPEHGQEADDQEGALHCLLLTLQDARAPDLPMEQMSRRRHAGA